MKLLVTGDWHLTKKRPRCRTDEDWMETQEKQLAQIALESSARKCPVLIVGDIFNKAVVPEEIVNLFLKFCHLMNNDVLFIAGNHDLPGHTMAKVDKSSIGILFNVMKMGTTKLVSLDKYKKEISYAHFGEEIQNPGNEILVLHELTIPSTKALHPDADAITAKEQLRLHPDAKYIITGDCHIPFHYKEKNRHVINPGHLNRQKTNELEQPIMYYLDTETEEIEEIEIVDDAELVTDTYLSQVEEREDRIEAFIEKVASQKEVSLSFEDNIAETVAMNKSVLEEGTVKMIDFLMEETVNDKL